MENGPFIGDLPIQIVIFDSYVKLPEGIFASEIQVAFGHRKIG